MAAEEFKGRGQTDALTAFFGTIRFWISIVGFVIRCSSRAAFTGCWVSGSR